MRLAAVEDRQQERGRRVAVERTWLREGAAAVLVLGVRAMARDLAQRDPTRHHDRHRAERTDPAGADRVERQGAGRDRQPAAARSSPERS